MSLNDNDDGDDEKKEKKRRKKNRKIERIEKQVGKMDVKGNSARKKGETSTYEMRIRLLLPTY